MVTGKDEGGRTVNLESVNAQGGGSLDYLPFATTDYRLTNYLSQVARGQILGVAPTVTGTATTSGEGAPQ